jgi:hypothetical protein
MYWQNMGWATFWATFSQTQLVTLLYMYVPMSDFVVQKWSLMKVARDDELRFLFTITLG